MLRDLKKNHDGLVLVTVLMIIMAILVITMTMLSLNVSQVMTTEREVKRLQAETLGLGVLTYAFFNQMNNPSSTVIEDSESLDNVDYSFTAATDPAPTGPYETYPVNVTVDY